MLTGKKIPFISENSNMSSALRYISQKKLGHLVARDKKKRTTGIITDGQIRRKSEKRGSIKKLKVKNTLKEFLTLSSPEKSDNDSDNVINNEEVTNGITTIPRQDSGRSNKNRSRRSKRKSRRG